jgi:protein-S-isoprenylcysteine O-methyltransferase Ste14
MPQDAGSSPNAIPWPPLIYMNAMLLAWTLEGLGPWAWLDQGLATLPRSFGAIFFTLGLALDLWSIATLRRHRTTVLPHAGASALVTTGPYRFSRNPIYLGNTLALVGLAMMLRWGWLLLLVPVTVTAVSWLAISREEQHLAKRFGTQWTEYQEKVRRWL